MANYSRIESALIHGGVFGDALTHSVNVPIYQTSTYQQIELEGNPKWEYSRTGNPTRAALEALIAELEGGTHGLAFASGMAAITAVLQLFKTGDRVLISSNVYGGTYRVLDRVFKQFGLEYGIVDTSDSTAIEAAITDDVRAILIESPANPLMTVTDIAAVSALAKAHGILTLVDNTFMTPYLQRPLALGADIVIHSATKYLGGHSDLVAGLVVVKDDALAEERGGFPVRGGQRRLYGRVRERLWLFVPDPPGRGPHPGHRRQPAVEEVPAQGHDRQRGLCHRLHRHRPVC